MKVLHVISSVDPRSGGPVEGVFSSSEVWFRHGHQRHIVSLDPPHAPWVATARAPTLGVGPDGALYRLARAWIPWLRYGYASRLVGRLRQNSVKQVAVFAGPDRRRGAGFDVTARRPAVGNRRTAGRNERDGERNEVQRPPRIPPENGPAFLRGRDHFGAFAT